MTNAPPTKRTEVIPKIHRAGHVTLVCQPLCVSVTSTRTFGATVSASDGLGHGLSYYTTGFFKLLAQRLLERTQNQKNLRRWASSERELPNALHGRFRQTVNALRSGVRSVQSQAGSVVSAEISLCDCRKCAERLFS